MLEVSLLKALVSLGIGGVAIGVFYLFLRRLKWPELAALGEKKSFFIVVLVLLLLSGLAFYGMYLQGDKKEKELSEKITVSPTPNVAIVPTLPTPTGTPLPVASPDSTRSLSSPAFSPTVFSKPAATPTQSIAATPSSPAPHPTVETPSQAGIAETHRLKCKELYEASKKYQSTQTGEESLRKALSECKEAQRLGAFDSVFKEVFSDPRIKQLN